MSKADTSKQVRRAHYKRITLWCIAIIVLGAMVLPMGSYVYTGIQEAQAQSVKDTNPRANYWRAVRDGQGGYSAVTGKSMDGEVVNTETSMLINNGGQNWRQIRNGLIANYGGWFLFLVLIAILLFFAKVGRVPIAHGVSGQKVQRWNALDRFVHWITAISFIVLAIWGLSLLFGRAVLIPLLAVIPMEDSKAVYVVNSTQAKRREVKLGIIRDDQIQIESGLEPGDKLIIAGHRFVAPGQKVNIVP